MKGTTLPDVQARVDALKKASMFEKAQSAEAALQTFLMYLAEQDARISELERMVKDGKG